MRRHSLAIQVSLLLFAILSQNRLTAQILQNKFDLTVGRGSTMTSPGWPSFFISFPVGWIVTEDAVAEVYFEKSFTLLEERKKLGAIVGIAPMFQLRPMQTVPGILFRMGVGVNLLSTREIGGRQLGSNFLFSPTLSAGIELPLMNNLLGVFYVFRHLSNAGFYEDNDGINFQYIVFCVKVADL